MNDFNPNQTWRDVIIYTIILGVVLIISVGRKLRNYPCRSRTHIVLPAAGETPTPATPVIDPLGRSKG